ncbi:methyl-accepting chemotaxis protein [Ferrovibrio sp. MS7]|uniref:methyl-accepting chemotaxis protein n=1 Tax=Ferrovibrio plantarum TaxID=3119164 RepID=UPI003136A364
MFSFRKYRLMEQALQDLDAVARRVAMGDFSARLVHTEAYGEYSPTLVAFNRALDLADAYLRESQASLRYAAAGKYFRPFLVRGMAGDFRRGAEQINAARRAMQAKAEEAARLELAVESERREAEIRARAEREKLAREFEAGVMAVVESVQSTSGQLAGHADQLASDTREAATAGAQAVSAADQATQNTQAIAAAAEELSATVQEVAQQVRSSREASKSVASEVGHASEAVAQLEVANRKIDEVVEFIRSVAFQTNLLALNASVEAARAGEAGKGFAVVAQEVRSLAQKTTEAAKDIAHQISAIQNASALTVRSIAVIQEQSASLDGRVGAIYDSTQEQAAATSDISGNIQEAAARTESVASNIQHISQSIERSGGVAEEVSQGAAHLQSQASLLADQVAAFLKSIRA